MEDDGGITLRTVDGSEAIIRMMKGDYRRGDSDKVEVRIGSRAEFLKWPKGCELKRHSQ